MFVASPPDFSAELKKLDDAERLVAVMQASASVGSHHDYLHWDKLRHLQPPGDLTHAEWWLGVKLGRLDNLRPFPLCDSKGRPFTYSMPDAVQRGLHQIDQRCSGEIAMPEIVTGDDQARRHYLVNSLMEEAIRSSQLEGATTSRAVAKDLLRSGRAPKDRSERMILNNYRALQFMGEMGAEITPQVVLELHRILTEGTLDNSDAAGRLQTPDDQRVAVFDRTDGSLIHKPPPANELPKRFDQLCKFANTSDGSRAFIHPVIRAILLHFWLAFDHPFEDGNGRTARTLFYWYMKTRGYWLTEYLSISRILRAAPAKYQKAFLLTETDERDTTYFILYQVEVIQRAIDELDRYLRRKIRQIKDVEKLARASAEFNHRQLAVLSDAIRNPGRSYTLQSHAASHDVTHETARTDLMRLYERGLMQRRRIQRRSVFTPVGGLADKLKTM